MEHATDASPANDVRPEVKPGRPWSTPKLTVVSVQAVTGTAGTSGQDFLLAPSTSS